LGELEAYCGLLLGMKYRLMILEEEIAKDNIYVNSVQSDQYGGLVIGFSNDYLLEVFPDDSLKEEYWRFFGNNPQEEHFIVFD